MYFPGYLYIQDGYTVVFSVLDAETVAQLLREADEVIASASELDSSTGDFNLEGPGGGYLGQSSEDTAAYRGVVRKVSNYVTHSPTALAVSQRIDIVDEIARHLEGPVRLAHSILWCKPPHGAGSAKPPHQDAPYLPGNADDYLTLWIALDQCTPQNGCLYMIPGSHQGGLREHVSAELQVGQRDWVPGSALPIELMPGSAVAFHPYTLHASAENTSDRPRRALMLRYQREQV